MIRVTSKLPSYRRANMKFSKVAVDFEDGVLSAETLEVLQGDTNLIVEVIGADGSATTSTAKPKGKAKR